MNKNCPSYDCGFCTTFPTFQDVKCGSEETKNCKWLDFDFKNTIYNEIKEK